MRNGLLALIVFFVLIVCPLTTKAEYEMDPGLVGMYLLDDQTTIEVHGLVLDDGDRMIGTYVNPFAPKRDITLEFLKDLLLLKAVQQESFALCAEGNTNFHTIQGVKSDVESWIAYLDITSLIANTYVNRFGYPSLSSYAMNVVDTALLAISQGLDCKPDDITQGSVEERNCSSDDNMCQAKLSMCDVLRHPFFKYAKNGAYKIIEKVIKDAEKKSGVGAQVVGKSASNFIGRLFSVVSYTLEAGDISKNILSSWGINATVLDNYDMALMLSDFTAAYIYYNQDVNKLKEIVEEVARNQKYPYITITPIKNFTELFFHYIQLRRNYDFGKYDFTKGTGTGVNLLSPTNRHPVNMELAPAAAEIMLENIERYGNGGNFKLSIAPKLTNPWGTGKTYTIESGSEEINPLYILPPINNIMVTREQYSDNYYLKIFGGVGLSLAAQNSGNCEKTTIQSTPLTSNVYFYGQITARPLQVFSVELKCNYSFENNQGTELFTRERQLLLENVFLPEVFPDVLSENVVSQHWSVKYISNLLDKGLVQGDKYGYFNPGGNLSIGECLKLVALGISNHVIGLKGFNLPGTISDNSNIPFGNYVDFFDSLSIDILPPQSSISTNEELKTVLDQTVTRKHVAKIVSNVLAEHMGSENMEDVRKDCNPTAYDQNGWDQCSATLRWLGIVKGVRTSTVGVYDFKRDSPITRAEFAKVLSRSIEVSYGLQKTKYSGLTFGEAPPHL